MDLSPPSPPPPTPSLFRSFPVMVIAIIGILATAFLLVGYYVFVIRCCLHWQRRRRRNSIAGADFSSGEAADISKNGLDEAVIRSIPVIKFRKLAEQERETDGANKKSEPSPAESYECAVCLSEFEDGEKLRVIPNCCHAFHIDCIDVWLQSSANCPLCRSGISPSSILCNNNNNNNERILAYPPPPPQNASCSDDNSDNFSGNDEDYVVVEIKGNNLDEPRLVGSQQEEMMANRASPKKGRGGERKKGKKLEHVSSMGDEWIDLREKDEEFGGVQPIRRSISMDLSSEREFCLEIQGVSSQQCGEIIDCDRTQDCNISSSSRVRRSIFSFGYGRSSRGSVQPLDP